MVVLWPNDVASQTPEDAGVVVTAEFGLYDPFGTGAYRHNGIDLVGWSIIIAPVSGVVSFAGYNGAAGNEVRIRADNGDVFRLLHNREIWVRTGDRVAQGQQVAVMGATGQATGVHCHYETRPGGDNPVNPRDYMWAANAGSPAGGDGTPVTPVPPKRKKNKMVNAAWRDDSGSIMVQFYPRGRCMEISDPVFWRGLQAAQGLSYAQVSNAEYQEIKSLYGTIPYASVDMEHSTGMVYVHDQGGTGDYLLVGGRLIKVVDENTLTQVQGRVPELWLPGAEVANLLKSQG